jgi:glyoxylase-like metal-dependent hydrolase (beta-lactamase superfamily II)
MEHMPEVTAFFDEVTNTVSYIVCDSEAKKCAIVDSVMDFHPSSGTISFSSANAIIDFVKARGYEVEWILETHAHADHLSAAPYLKENLGGMLAIGEHITTVQKVFGKVFNEGTKFERDGSQFDVLFKDGDTFSIGSIPALVMYTPGHTPVDVSFVIGDAVFVGDTLFMPDYGTARVDFPGGSAETLFDSVQKLFTLPESMRMFMCHDYLPKGRTEYQWETTVGEEKKHNVHLNENTSAEEFVEARKERDATLGMPRLIIPSIPVNIHGGRLPSPDESGTVFLKIPINAIFSRK